MSNPVENGLAKLRGLSAQGDLDTFEAEVWSKVSMRSQDPLGGRMLRAQVAVTAMALLMGYAVSEMVAVRSGSVVSEMAVLSDDIAPSVRLEGGV
jgi:hypothetical protein